MSEQMDESEIRQYIEMASDDLAAAKDNVQLGHLRVAVSRAYYAMFYAATAVLGSRGLWRSKHQGIIAAFGEHLVKPGLVDARYGRMLHGSFETRVDSDYAPLLALDEAAVVSQITDAEEFVQQMIKLLSTPPAIQGKDYGTA